MSSAPSLPSHLRPRPGNQAQAPAPRAAPQTIDFGETVNGTLDTNDCLRTGGAFQESWELVLANDITARIDLESAEFDAFLVLKDSQGNVIATDDDGGTGLNSRIERVLAAGTYEIVASSFGPNQTGAYQLTVDGPPPMPGAARTDGKSEMRPKAAPDSESASERLARMREVQTIDIQLKRNSP